jgi:hypothetical protein
LDAGGAARRIARRGRNGWQEPAGPPSDESWWPLRAGRADGERLGRPAMEIDALAPPDVPSRCGCPGMGEVRRAIGSATRGSAEIAAGYDEDEVASQVLA